MRRRTRITHKNRHSSGFPWLTLLIPVLVILSGGWFYYRLNHLKSADSWLEVKKDGIHGINLPQDDLPHHDKMEWWYYNGRLTSRSGRHFSFHMANFAVNNLMNHRVSHVSLTDLDTGRHYTDQRLNSGALALQESNPFAFQIGDWLMNIDGGNDRLKVPAKGFKFELQLTNRAAPVSHGMDGLLEFGEAGSSYYYSRPRLGVVGVIKDNQLSEPVEGLAWFDHQWGNFAPTQLAWDWFSLQLNDGSELMVYNITDRKHRLLLRTATLSRDGNTQVFDASRIQLKPGKTWTSGQSGITYPLEWQLSIPEKNINMLVTAVTKNNEFDAKLTSYNIYWEGAVNVGGSHSGQGFMELNGYSR